jgi:hypothetical protein
MQAIYFYFQPKRPLGRPKYLLKSNIKMAVPIMEFEGMILVQILQNRPSTGIL